MESVRIITKNSKETQKVARVLAEEITTIHSDTAIVVALKGDLGAGKTTFAQGFARAFGVKENVLSPTFVLMKIYDISRAGNLLHKHFIHIDCYRLTSPDDLLHLGFHDLLSDNDAVIIIEWADRVKNILPKNAIWISFEEGKKKNERVIVIKK